VCARFSEAKKPFIKASTTRSIPTSASRPVV